MNQEAENCHSRSAKLSRNRHVPPRQTLDLALVALDNRLVQRHFIQPLPVAFRIASPILHLGLFRAQHRSDAWTDGQCHH